MMKWNKRGRIYAPDSKISWATHSTLQPTPIILDHNTIRLYLGFRDDDGVSRVGFVDVDADNPSTVTRISESPVLDIGIPGAFDDNGVVPCAVLKMNKLIYLYYAGYQVGFRIRFTVFAGLAFSNDGGNSFERYSNVPILERTNEELCFRVIHSILFEDGIWKTWYGAGSNFIVSEHKTIPRYNIRYMESEDGIHFPKKGSVIIDTKGDEQRVGRPYVINDNGVYKMFFCAESSKIPYRLCYADSVDNVNWIRKDNDVGIELSEHGWDSQMMAYPSVIRYKDNFYRFYNGNDYGKTGFGYAILN